MTKCKDVCAGIVIYNPEIKRLQDVICAICQQVEELILVDNGSTNISEIVEVANEQDNVHLMRNSKNEGIAKALNQICSYSLGKGYEWCLTLDHDTVCHEGMVSQLMNYRDRSKIGIVCPRVDYEDVNIKQKNTESETVDVYACMTSGSLTNLSAWKQIGGFRESYFIDYVDNEFCMRLGLAGYRIVRVNGCIMHHRLGESVKKRLFYIFPVTVTTHNPWRFYYMTRNNLLFIDKYRKHLNITKEYAKITSIIYHGILYSNHRRETVSYIWRGVKDAHRHREGEME